jgi:ribosome-associated translation inhibitor RaiA
MTRALTQIPTQSGRSRAASVRTPEIVVQTSGPMPRTSAEYARKKVAALTGHVNRPILHARVRLTRRPDPAVERPAVAQANLDLDGRILRAQVAAVSMREAIDALQDRLRDRIERVEPHWEARRGGVPSSAEPGAVLPPQWRHASEPARRPAYFPRPVEEREVVRHKTFALAVESVDEAVSELESMDYDFHLFTDVETGEDGVLYRAGPTGYRLAEVHGLTDGHGPTAVPLTFSPHDAPALTRAEAISRLELMGLPFVFYANPVTGRGAVVYHRYDGHYGLITPSE